MELLSRGKQDAYFIQNARRTWFGADYERRNGAARDITLRYPYTPCQFNSRVDIELPRFGDVLKAAEIRIQMPTWLPPEIEAINRLGSTIEIECPDPIEPEITRKTTFGWTNGIMNYLIERWQLFADNIMLAEGYGEINTWLPFTDTTQNRAPILNATTGIHDGSNTSIQWNATLPELTFRLPLPGCQTLDDAGLPLWIMRAHQKIFVRLWFAPMSKLAESGRIVAEVGPTASLPLYALCPTPWGGKRIYVNDVATGYVTKQEYEVGNPVIYARYDMLHVDEETRAGMRAVPYSLPFRSQMIEILTFDQKTLFAGYNFSKRLEIKGFYDALYVRFLSVARFQQNKFSDTRALNESGNWVSQMGLVVNSQDRINPWSAEELYTVAINTQVPHDVDYRLYYLVFGQQIDKTPAGNLLLTRTDKTLLNFTFAAVQNDPVLPTTTFCYLAVLGLESQVIDIKDGFCSVRYA